MSLPFPQRIGWELGPAGECTAAPSTSERLDRLPKEDALIPGLLAPTCLLPSQSRIHCEILRHCYMSVEAEFVVPTPGSLVLCKSHQGPTDAPPVACRVNCNVIKQKMIIFR